MRELKSVEHLEFFFQTGIAEAEPHQKTVQLSLWKRERAFVVDRVLSGDDDERRLQFTSLAVHADRAFRHGFQQSRLSPRGRTVDLIGQDKLSENRARSKFKLLYFGIRSIRETETVSIKTMDKNKRALF